MIPMTISEVAAAIGGRVVPGGGSAGDTVVNGTCDTDSRNIGAGDLFFAKPGETTDGHRFAPAAVEQGAALVVVERELELDAPQIVVDDVVIALGALAREVVERVRAKGRLRVVAVTGSNGKTTTKNLLKSIFERQGNVVAPIASFNNEVGGPVTFLKVTDETDTLVAEMGASSEGEIARLTEMARPDIGIVLVVGLAHVGVFGGVEATARAKAEMVAALDDDGVAVLNFDDPRVLAMAEQAKGRVVTFGRGAGADVRADDLLVDVHGTSFTLTVRDEAPVPVRFPVIGEHHVMNALAAAAAAHIAGIPATEVAAVLAEVTRAESARMEVLAREPITVINDAFNANPDSMRAALRTLAQIAAPEQRTVAVLGEMGELGDQSIAEHDRIGELVVRLGIAQTVVVGRGARALFLGAVAQGSWDGEATFVENAEEAYDFLVDWLKPGDLVLVKSSKSAGLRALGDRLGDYVKGLTA